MSVTRRYRDVWEGFWEAAPERVGAVLWDAEPALTAGVHLALFEPHMTEHVLPVVDLGCGNGTQTRYLADRFPLVAGVDLAPAAIARARSLDPGGRVRFTVADATDPAAVRSLRTELGDAQVYLRGVLHQAGPADREALAGAVAELVGERGRAFVVEPAEAAGDILDALARDPEGPPPKLRPLLAHGIATGGLAEDQGPELFRAAGLRVLAAGELPLTTTEYLVDGTRIELPARWLVVGRGR
ncbi:class I SAM-dependent methyltransferase [Streptomyces candidus]|uniref:SAM-dependent methyltransferase n=1 Tax=Streptomyces candidus TaxID=67283 RepID=A0A7X0HBP4_9ACTN|nr:class I SAM-dependent methyltransferase [Streptomyces candidus]MBB6434649.1 SAM-dependent methyltransferase [Streptomyces candidus]GHH35916.1 methyltransferase [Streptomyces candidus]